MRLIFLLLFIAFLNSCSPDKPKDMGIVSVPAETVLPKYNLAQSDSIALIILNTTFENYPAADSRKSLEEILKEIDDFKMAKSTISAYSDFTKEGQAKLDHTKKLIIKIQKRDFPVLRKNFTLMMDKRLWENNVKADVYGDRNTIVILVGSSFADHAVIKASQEGIRDRLVELRFKRIIYKWYTGDQEYTKYDLQSPDDNDLF